MVIRKICLTMDGNKLRETRLKNTFSVLDLFLLDSVLLFDKLVN